MDLVAGALAGCSGGAHQVVTDASACGACHPADRAVDPNGTFKEPSVVYSATGQIAVTVKSTSMFYVCRPVATVDGAKLQPFPILRRGSINVTGGEPYTMTLEPGAYLLVAQADGKAVSQYVIVDASAAKTVDAVALKL